LSQPSTLPPTPANMLSVPPLSPPLAPASRRASLQPWSPTQRERLEKDSIKPFDPLCCPATPSARSSGHTGLLQGVHPWVPPRLEEGHQASSGR
jgi:hypothetical protein